jgi:hypothetical protein
MKKIIISVIFLGLNTNVLAISFSEAIDGLSKHESVEIVSSQSRAFQEQSGVEGAWGDPNFKISAKNFPKDSMKDGETPMTGIEFGISQKIPLTTKYGNISKSYKSLSTSLNHEMKNRKNNLTKSLWEIVILQRKIKFEKIILLENQVWIEKILKVSKKLYANGKISQQALLDIQIRKSEIDILISNKNHELYQLNSKLGYLIGENQIISLKTIPWKILNMSAENSIDHRELSFKKKLESNQFQLTAAKLNYVPDLTVSLSITKRSEFDDLGDFVGVGISFPLPFSSKKYSKHEKATQDKFTAQRKLDQYRKSKKRETSILTHEISKLEAELKILSRNTVRFAKNSRSITSKSYGLGSSTYLELLQSELTLQKILLHKVSLESIRDTKKIELKYILGEPLHE